MFIRMNVAAGPELAAAVINAGGLGVIGGVGYRPKILRQQVISFLQSLTPLSSRCLKTDNILDRSTISRRNFKIRMHPSELIFSFLKLEEMPARLTYVQLRHSISCFYSTIVVFFFSPTTHEESYLNLLMLLSKRKRNSSFAPLASRPNGLSTSFTRRVFS